MKLFPAKCHERATVRKLWRQTGNRSLLPGQQFTVDCCCKWWLESQRGFQILLLSFLLLYNKSLNDWSLGEQWILFPSNLNVSLDFVSGNIEILGKQNSLFPSGPVIKCLLFDITKASRRRVFKMRTEWHDAMAQCIQLMSKTNLTFLFNLNQNQAKNLDTSQLQPHLNTIH